MDRQFISPVDAWQSLKIALIAAWRSLVGGYTTFAFDVSPSRRNASLVAGQILPDGRIGIGLIPDMGKFSFG